MARQDRFLGNNLLGNRPNPPPTPYLPAADLDVDTPHTGKLSFECASQGMLDLVSLYLNAGHPSALLDNEGGRVYVAAAEPIVGPDQFPARVSISVEIIDNPGPVEL